MRKSLLALALAALAVSSCAQLDGLLNRPEQKPKAQAPAPVQQAQTSVVENPNYIEKPAAQQALETQFADREDVEILVYEGNHQAPKVTAGSNLPDFASGSEFAESQCEDIVAPDLPARAALMTERISGRLNLESGAAYVAPTAIPAQYRECIQDLSPAIKESLSRVQSPLIPLAAGTNEESRVSQNAGSSTLIPTLVRACRQNSIPYLVVSTIREVGGQPALTIRAVRVSDGVTLAQALEQVGAPEPAPETAPVQAAAAPASASDAQ